MPQLLLGMVALALGLVLAGGAVGEGIKSSRRSGDTIVVAGSARRPVEADQANWVVSATSRQPTPEAATRELKGWFDRIDAFLRDGSIDTDEVTRTPVSLERLVNADDAGREVFVGYGASRSLRVESKDLDAVDDLATASESLILDGIPIETSSPEFVYTKLAGNRPAMVAEAGEDAKRRAQRLVKVGGGHLGKVRKVTVGDFQVTSRAGTDFESGGTFDRSSRHKDIVVVVHLTFELK